MKKLFVILPLLVAVLFSIGCRTANDVIANSTLTNTGMAAYWANNTQTPYMACEVNPGTTIPLDAYYAIQSYGNPTALGGSGNRMFRYAVTGVAWQASQCKRYAGGSNYDLIKVINLTRDAGAAYSSSSVVGQPTDSGWDCILSNNQNFLDDALGRDYSARWSYCSNNGVNYPKLLSVSGNVTVQQNGLDLYLVGSVLHGYASYIKVAK